jgi:hypothetical protein
MEFWVLVGLDFALAVLVGFSSWHNLRGCPGKKAAQGLAEWDLTLSELVDELVERTKRIERVRSQVQRERGIIEKHQKKAQAPIEPSPDAEGISPEDAGWIQSWAAEGGSAD